MYNFGGKPRKTEYMEAAKLEPWPGGGGGLLPIMAYMGRNASEHLWRQNHNDKPVRVGSAGSLVDRDQ